MENKKIFFNISYDYNSENKEEIVKSLTHNIEDSETGYAGFDKKESLESSLKRFIFDSQEDHKEEISFKTKINPEDTEYMKKQFEEVIGICEKEIKIEGLRVFVFPSFSKFIHEKMSGVSGCTPWKKVLLLFVDNSVEGWKEMFKKTLAHEYNHCCAFENWFGKTILDNIILEGLAENFMSKILKKEPSQWSKNVERGKCKEIFNGLGKRLNEEDSPLFFRLFYEGKKYPLWTGYSMGYQIVKDFLEKNPHKSWEEIMKMKPKEIIENSSWDFPTQ